MARRYNFIPTSQAKNLKLLDIPECIHLTESGRCKIMNVRQCAGKACSFMQRSINIQSSEENWARRLNSLDEETQFSIAKKYYAGRMPWKQ